MLSGLFYLMSLDRSISNRRGVWLLFLLLPRFIEVPVFSADSVDPDQMPPALQYMIWVYTVC